MSPEARAARERKQKIFVVAGGLFLVALLAIQLPKLLGGSTSAESAAPVEATTTPIVAAQSVAAAANGAQVTPGGTPVAHTTFAKLTSLSLFVRKDPFVQQQVVGDSVLGAQDAAPETGTPKNGGKVEAPAKQFSTGAAAAVTIVTVNGARQVLQPGMKFPAGDPVFVLVAEKPGSKSVVVAIAGGAYAGGATKTTLKIGRPLTLVNTTTHARYTVSLVSVGNGQSADTQASQATP